MTTKFIVSANKRCGSHYLATSLNSHPDVRCRGESYRPMKQDASKDWFDKMFMDKEREYQAIGFILQRINGGRHGRFSNLRERVKKVYPDVKIIRYYRNDLLAQYVSHVLASKRKQWNCLAWHDKPEDVTVTLSIKCAIEFFNKQVWLWRADELEWAGFPQIVVQYEEVREDLFGSLLNCWDFLNVTPYDAKPMTQIQNYRPLEEVVTNWERIESATRGQRYLMNHKRIK